MTKPSTDDEITNFLYNLKLRKYEVEAYLTLLKHGPQNYKGLIELSSVPYGKIYATLNILDRKGWVTTLNLKPKIFSAVDPEVPLRDGINTIRNWVTALEEAFRRINPQLKTLYDQSRKTSEDDL
jgi:sugar-specific transcriptional regulator TrmB